MVTAASHSVSALDCSFIGLAFNRAFASCSRCMMNTVEVPTLQLHLQDPLRVERNKVRLRQETQLSDTDIAKALLILLQDGYTGAGNDSVGRCLMISPTRA